ncbi:matrixin family metalloprotease [Pseudogemmatithrix spongiicola]|uniref:Matrixin family metalloprotease n=1 Tax=Pseudogemmatithrix spongiicola TaxID=3062599 RepID=A0AA49K2U8_9BACT|nr:matrixin family metalloprotease [Gemmatimonadaceae bacterium 'strain 138']WKW16328.1 matrixin family metalloprotease [Gemmatimonadaceae bacterium 'strain 318']
MRPIIAVLALVACSGSDTAPRARHIVVEEDAPAALSASGELEASGSPAPERDPVAIAAALDLRAPDTYLPELLEMRDGWSYRWRDRSLEPMRVWIEPSSLGGYTPDFAREVEAAFEAWARIGLPFVFTFVRDSARAEVHVTWVERFEGRMTGRTMWRHDEHGWITAGSIQLSLQLPDGRPVVREGVRAVALHEVGHLIGLDHPEDATSVMSAQVFVTDMSEADRRTARLVYDLPPGRIRP